MLAQMAKPRPTKTGWGQFLRDGRNECTCHLGGTADAAVIGFAPIPPVVGVLGEDKFGPGKGHCEFVLAVANASGVGLGRRRLHSPGRSRAISSSSRLGRERS